MIRRFHHDCLPDPIAYFEGEGLRLRGRGAWRTTTCLFHDDKHPSLSVNIDTGSFRCFACGARGGDVLDFHRLRHELGFVDAAKALGAWRSE